MKLNIRTRMMLSILAVTLLCAGALAWCTYSNAARLVEAHYTDALTGRLQIQAAQFDTRMESAYRAAVALSCADSLRAQLDRYLAQPDHSHAQTDEAWALTLLLKDAQENGAVTSYYLYVPQTGQVISSNDYQAILDPAALDGLAQTPRGTGLTPGLYEDSAGGVPRMTFVYTRPVLDARGGEAGLLLANLDVGTLYFDLLDTAQDGVTVCVAGPDGTLLAGADASRIGSPLADVSGLPALTGAVQSGVCGTGAAEQIYAAVRTPFSRCHVVGLSAKQALMGDLRQVRWLFLGLMLILLPVVFLLSFYLSRRLYHPIGQLMQVMGRVGEGDLTARTDLRGSEEFRSLGEQFNRMVEQIDDLLGERVRCKQAELDALQHQIKPHFMYNTLNSIRYAAILQGNEKIGEQLGAFIELLEASVSRKGAFLPLCDEIGLVRSYVSLQKYRYLDGFEAEYHISDTAAGCFVPTLLLQPLVENALLHGMDMKAKGNRLTVSAWTEADRLHITVADNGRGMTQADCAALLVHNPQEQRQFTGIGLANIQARLMLYYGTQASFTLESTPGAGTQSEIIMPASRDAKEYAQ